MLTGLLALGLASCQGIMRDQPKYEALEASTLFADGRSARPVVPGTVHRGALDQPESFYTGFDENGELLQEIPIPIDEETLEAGRDLYDAFCSPCHGLSGYGQGIVVQRGFPPPPSYHQDYLRQAPDGHIYDVITNGQGLMYKFDYRLKPAERWAVVAYVRALQLSQFAPEDVLPQDDLDQISGGNP